MADLKTRLNSCYSPQYTKISDLGPNVPYKIVEFAKVQTRYGETIRATIVEGITGDDVLLSVYLPHRFLAILSDTAIENYNKGPAGERLSLMYRGPGKGVEFI